MRLAARLLMCAGCCGLARAEGDAGRLWTVIVDAGSTGSRLWAYHIGAAGASSFDGGVVVRRGGKVKPGLATLAGDAPAAARQLLALFQSGAELVPEAERRSARAIIRGTGGLRDDLDEAPRNALLEAVFDELSSEASFPFSLSREDVGIVTGGDESFYAFAAANFLEGSVDHALRPTARLIGALDLGGSSTQITYAFEPNATCAAADGAPPFAAVSRGELYARSYAGFGAQAVRERAMALAGGADPCAHAGHEGGSGDFAACLAAVRAAVVGDERASACGAALDVEAKRSHCALDKSGPRMLALASTTRFIAMCNYFYTADALRVLADDSPNKAALEAHWPTPPLDALHGVAAEYCALPWAAVWPARRGAHRYTPDALLQSRCFEAAYVLVLLRDAFALDAPNEAPRVTFALDARGGAEVEWTLGFFLAEVVNASAALHV